jgi:hypothetical protein
MTRAAVTQADIVRAVKGVQKAVDQPISRVEIDANGTIRVWTGSAEESSLTALEGWRRKRGPRAA